MTKAATVSAIILTGGQGRRLKQADGAPKQFANVAGAPLFVHCLKLYESIEAIDEIILVINADYIDQYRAILSKYPFKKLKALVGGGDFRHVSIQNGLAQVTHDGVVVIQNGVNPTTPVNTILDSIALACEFGAASAYVPASHTVFELAGDEVGQVLARKQLGYTCDPQAFKVQMVKEALRLAVSQQHGDIPVVDLVKKLGHAVKLVESNEDNLKVSKQLDLMVVEHILLSTKT